MILMMSYGVLLRRSYLECSFLKAADPMLRCCRKVIPSSFCKIKMSYSENATLLLFPRRQWRERKDHYGEMFQMDGSHHDWFEGRGPKCALMASTDDVTGIVHARFYEYEGTIPAMDSFKRYVTQYGIPMSVYLDKHTTYKSLEMTSGRQNR